MARAPKPTNPQEGNKAKFVLEWVDANLDARATLDARCHDRDEAES